MHVIRNAITAMAELVTAVIRVLRRPAFWGVGGST
jgi:hypothetical protein